MSVGDSTRTERCPPTPGGTTQVTLESDHQVTFPHLTPLIQTPLPENVEREDLVVAALELLLLLAPEATLEDKERNLGSTVVENFS